MRALGARQARAIVSTPAESVEASLRTHRTGRIGRAALIALLAAVSAVALQGYAAAAPEATVALIPASLQPADAAPPGAAMPPGPQTEIQAKLDNSGLHIAGERIHPAVLRRFYAAHNFEPVWDKHPQQAAALLNAVSRSHEHGLDPDSFHAGVLAKATQLPPTERDILLSDAFLAYADALSRGAVTIENRMDDEDLAPAPVDIAAALDAALAGPNPAAAIEALAPNTREYAAMRRAYGLYRAAKAGGWPRITDAQRPLMLQQRLAAEGYLSPGHETNVFDAATGEALRAFQRHHGLEADGRLGQGTLAELNISADERARQVAVNLERLRWLPRTIPADRVWVNTADAKLELFRDNRPTFTTRVVVGEIDKQTPEFHTDIVSLLYNPPWNVPYSIATKEILPKLSADPNYLTRHHMVRRSNGAIQQLPGNGTALGQLKFEMPNRYDVYLHDTPQKALFSRDNRHQSHGCVRVQNPRELASLLIQQPVDAINKAIAGGTTHRQNLAVPIPVFLVYQTAFAAADGMIEFRRDSYRRDDGVWRALNHMPQTPVADQAPAQRRS